jgi:hypothetical protein
VQKLLAPAGSANACQLKRLTQMLGGSRFADAAAAAALQDWLGHDILTHALHC